MFEAKTLIFWIVTFFGFSPSDVMARGKVAADDAVPKAIAITLTMFHI